MLHNILGWQIQCIVDFMYKGETSVPESQLQSLVKAAESLKVRGLTSGDNSGAAAAADVSATAPRSSAEGTASTGSPYTGRRYTPSPSAFAADGHQDASPMSLTREGSDHEAGRSRSPQGSGPRRKQARPRRRSGDSVSGHTSLELTKGESSPTSHHGGVDGHHGGHSPASHNGPENLCLKRPSSSPAINLVSWKFEIQQGFSSISRPLHQ